MNKSIDLKMYNKNKWIDLGRSMKYALYVSTHPLDGFWDLTHEKRGSLAAANFIVLLMAVVQILTLTLTDFQFIIVYMKTFNAIIAIMQLVLPLALWTVANWGLTTLLDGKGRLSEIYMASAYALTPYVLISAVMIIISRLITFDEGTIYYFLGSVSVIWSTILFIAGMMMIHDFSLAKTLLCGVLTIVGIGVMVFIFVMFFSIISDGVMYFISLYKEIVFRLS